MTKTMWARIVAALQTLAATEKQLEASRESWETAKATRDERAAAHNEEVETAAEEHPTELPDDVWQRIQGLYMDLRRAEETFDSADRARRSNQDLLKKLTERIVKLNKEAYGDEGELPFAKGEGNAGPAWKGVMLADYMGEAYAAPYAKCGIATLADAKAAVECRRHLQLARTGEISDEQARYLAYTTVERLDAAAVEHTCERIAAPPSPPPSAKKKGRGGDEDEGGEPAEAEDADGDEDADPEAEAALSSPLAPWAGAAKPEADPDDRGPIEGGPARTCTDGAAALRLQVTLERLRHLVRSGRLIPYETPNGILYDLDAVIELAGNVPPAKVGRHSKAAKTAPPAELKPTTAKPPRGRGQRRLA